MAVRPSGPERGQRHGRVFEEPPRRDAAFRRQGCRGKGVPHAAVLHEFVLALCAVPQSIFELDPGILLFDLGASLLCHKTGNDLTGTTWLGGRLQQRDFAGHHLAWGQIAAAPAHTPCDPPPPPLTSSFFARPRIHNEEQSRRGDEPQLLPGPSGAELVSSPATGVGQVLRESRRGPDALRPYHGPRMGDQQRLPTLQRPPHL